MFKKRLFVFALVMIMIFSLALTGCTQEEEPPVDEAGPIKIGLITPKTGQVAQYGLAVDKATALAVEKINQDGGLLGREVVLISYDSKGDVTESVSAFNKLLDSDNIDFLLGPVISSTSLGVGPLADAAGIPMITPTGTNLEITVGKDFVFRTCFTDPYQGGVVGKFAATNLEAKTATILTNTGSDYSVGLADAFREEFEKNGGTVINEEGYTDSDKDFKVILTNVKQKNPDVIFVPDYYNQAGLIAEQAKEVGIDSVFLGGDGWDSIQIDYAEVTEGSYFANHYATDDPSEVVQNFLTIYQEKYNEVPNSFAALGYDAALSAFAAIENAGTTDKAAVRDALATLDMPLVTGNIKFDENGDTIKGVSIIKIENGELKLDSKVSID
ncbi:MAG: ABC transporter substrate-binding protein [Peptostreptococcales bacterium]